MPNNNKRTTKNKNPNTNHPTNPVIDPIFNTTPFNDFTNITNIHLLLQQQQNQIMALSKAATQQEKASSFAIPNNYDNSATTPIVASGQATSPSPITSDTQIGTSKLTNRWTPAEIRILIKEVGEYQQALQKVKDPRKKGQIWDKIVSNLRMSGAAS